MKRTCLSLIIFYNVFLAPVAEANKTVQEWAFTRLDYVRKEKVHNLKRYCDNIHKQAQTAGTDQVMLNFFDIKHNGHDLRLKGLMTDEFEKKLIDFRKQISDYYIQNYISFYDILFISKTGDIFYTIRKESEYLNNIFDGKLTGTNLSRQLSKKPKKEVFVDFEYFSPSKKPAAFFIEPAIINDKHLGWIVLQCTLNKVNSLFIGSDRLGMTGETFLVNEDGFLLTESNFIGDSTILKMHLDDNNIKTKFQERIGNKIIVDYRGFAALSSFEVFDFLETRWLVVAKVDQAQIATEHFQQQSDYYFEKIGNYLSSNWPCTQNSSSEEPNENAIMVDMDEFVKADNQEILRTIGVSTCTAVIATYPGKFGYLAHISPYDEMYGGKGTNVLSLIIQKVKGYDINNYEKRRVNFFIIANHLNSFENIVNKLIEEGFLLSQINMLHYPQAKYANVIFDYSKNLTNVEWVKEENGQTSKITQNVCTDNNLGTIIQRLLEK